MLKQPQYKPMELEEQIVILFAATNGYADDVQVDEISKWEIALLRNIETSHSEILKDIAKAKIITDKTEEKLHQAVETFNRSWLD